MLSYIKAAEGFSISFYDATPTNPTGRGRASNEKVLSNKELVKRKMFDFSDCTETGISFLTWCAATFSN